jgi:bleomycin hydrolase
MHEDYYKPFILEIPDNWSWAESYNVPLDELEEIVDSSLIRGYSVCWATDVSETGFNFSKGLAVAPKICYSDDNDRGLKKWIKKSITEKDKVLFNFDNPVEELEVTPEIRQAAFDDFSTTDDHGMHILGLARDKSGRILYYVKNSWGTDNPFGGYFFVSKPYFRYKTISIMVNKEAIPGEILNKLAL